MEIKEITTSEAALLAEYEVCQQHTNSAAAISWQAIGIILAAALGGLILVLLTFKPTLANSILISIIGVLAILLLVCTLSIFRREAFFRRASRRRMREIETVLGLRSKLYINVLGNWPKRANNEYWNALPKEEQDKLQNIYIARDKGAPRLTTSLAISVIFCATVVAWSLLLIWVWVIQLGWLCYQ